MENTRTAQSRRRFLGGGAATLLTGPAVAAGSKKGNATLATLDELRTTHGTFSDKEVSDAQIETILSACVRAANASLTQSYSIVVVRDRAIQQTLSGYKGSCTLLYCADHNRMIATAARLGHDYRPDNMEAFIPAAMNAILAAQTAVIAARSLGIDSMLTNGVHRGDMERLWTTLDLPKQHCFPLIALVLGYAVAPPPNRTGRLKGPGVVHQGKYHRLTEEQTDRIIAQYDDESQHLTLNSEWRGKHKHYLDWFHLEWEQRGRKAGESEISKRLRACGYGETPAG